MDIEMQKANLLAENIKGFVYFVHHSQENHNSNYSNLDQLYRLKLLVDEYKLQLFADELSRVNRFVWDGRETGLLLEQIKKGIKNMDEYVTNNYEELFMFSARLYTIKALLSSFKKI